jgi:hypothetical protein
MNEKSFIDNIDDETLAKMIDKTLNFKKTAKTGSVKTQLLKIIPAAAAIAFVIGFINITSRVLDDAEVSPGNETEITKSAPGTLKITEEAEEAKKEDITYFDGDGTPDEVIFALGFIAEDGSLIDEPADGVNIVNAYPKLTVNFGNGETIVRRFDQDYRTGTGGFETADLDGDGTPEIIVELQSMGSIPGNHVYVLKYGKDTNDFYELSALYGYEFEIKRINDSQFTVSCEETGFVSELNNYSDILNPDNIFGSVNGVNGIEFFRIVQETGDIALEIYQYAWDGGAHAANIGYAVSVFGWQNGEFSLLSQRFEEVKKAGAEGITEVYPGLDFAPVIIIDPPPEEEPAPLPAEIEEEAYKFISWHHNSGVFMNNDELKPEINMTYAILQTYYLENALGTEFIYEDGALMIPVQTVKDAVSYMYKGLDGGSVEDDPDKISVYQDKYFRMPDGISPEPVWAFIQFDTLTVGDNGMCKFDVVFYGAPPDDSDRGEELRRFAYEFQQVLYKDSSAKRTVCYKFIGAARYE